MRLRRIDFAALGTSEPEPHQEPDAWDLLSVSDEALEDDDLFQQIRELKSRNDQKNALASLHKLVQVAATGHPISGYYDKKECHETHHFKYQGKTRKIWRIRKGDIRLFFYYGKHRLILLPAVFAKRSDKLTAAQCQKLEAVTKAFIEAEASNTIIIIAAAVDADE